MPLSFVFKRVEQSANQLTTHEVLVAPFDLPLSQEDLPLLNTGSDISCRLV
jgi:hypothetical protein